MATEAGLAYNHDDYPDIWDTYMNVGREEIMAFAKLIAAKEREACAKLCDELVNEENSSDYQNAANYCSIRIRARGET